MKLEGMVNYINRLYIGGTFVPEISDVIGVYVLIMDRVSSINY